MLERFKAYIKQNSNIPNAITLMRLLLVPYYWHIYFTVEPALLNSNIRLAIVAVASVSDFLDGYIARKKNLITNFGKLFDPLADKLMLVSVLISQYRLGIIPLAPILVLAVKDGLLILGSLILLKRKIVVYSNLWGKLSTVCFIVAIFLTFFAQYFTLVRFDVILIWISVTLSMIALLSYILRAIGFLNK